MDSPNHNSLMPFPARQGPLEATPALGLSTRPASLHAAPDAVGLLKAFRRRWLLALGLGMLLAAIVGPLVWYVVPRAKYTAMSTLQISTKPKRIIFEPKEGQADFRSYQQTQLALIKDRKVLSFTLNKRDVAKLPTIQAQEDALGWLESQLNAEFVGGSEVLKVSISGDRPGDLAAIVNEVVKSYLELVVDAEYKGRLARLEQLKQLSTKYQNTLDLKRKSYQDLAKSLGVHDQTSIALAEQFKVESIGMAKRELMRVHSEILKAEAEIAAREAARPSEILAPVSQTGTVDPRLESDPRVVELRTQIAALKQAYGNASRIARKQNDPAVKHHKIDLDRATARLNSLRAALRAESFAGRPGPTGGEGRSGTNDIAGLQNEVGVLKVYHEALTKEVHHLESELRVVNEGGLNMDTERQAIDIMSETFDKVGFEVEAVQVELGAPERVQLLAEAQPPKKRDETKKIKAGGIAAFGAFAFALLGISYWEFTARHIDAIDDILGGLGIRVVGSLPGIPKASRRLPGEAASLKDRRWQGLMVESVDAIRTMLLHASRLEPIRVVMVTSADKGEGKTSLACHLATSLARAGRRTLLADCDLRCPSAHRLFDVFSQPGFCEILTGEAGVSEAIQPTGVMGLDIIPAGRCGPLALQAIAQHGLRRIFDDLSRDYDIIVVDSAPILAVADSQLMCQEVDGVILSVLRHVSRQPRVYAAYERLAGLGARMIGAVVSGIQSDTSSYEPYYAAYRSDD